MINFDDVIKQEIEEHNPNWPEIPELARKYRILIIGGSRLGKTSSIFNLINQQPDIDKIYLCTKYLNEAKYQFLIKNVRMLQQSSFYYLIVKLLLNT